MSQERIISLLKRHYKRNKERWFTSKDMEKILKLGNGSITKNLRKLREANLIRFRIIKNSKNMDTFQYKHKVK